MSFPLGTLLDPLLEQVDLVRCERSAQRLRRHPVGLILGRDPPDQLAVVEVSGHDRVPVRLEPGEGPFLGVQPQPSLALAVSGPWQLKHLSDRMGRI